MLDEATGRGSLISHGCRIRGHVEHPVLSPDVIVREGAVVRDSVIMTDSVIEAGAVIERCILDKAVTIGTGTRIGLGSVDVPNLLEPTRLNTGITLIGRNARVPADATIGRNVLIAPDVQERRFLARDIPSGEAIDIQVPTLSY